MFATLPIVDLISNNAALQILICVTPIRRVEDVRSIMSISLDSTVP